MYNIFPRPREVLSSPGVCRIFSSYNLRVDNWITDGFEQAGFRLEEALQKLLSPFGTNGTLSIQILFVPEVPAQGFRLDVQESGIRIEASSAQGAYYALGVLEQLLTQCSDGTLSCLHIEDAPALNLRGIMLDIGRNKIPTMETLYQTIDMLFALRINHLQLYMEGFCFDYPAYRSHFPDETPITAEEFQALSTYARQHFIDLVPNQNCLGHMDQWLALPQFRELAECPEGFLHLNLYRRPPMTLDVRDPKALELAESLFSMLLPNFTSDYVNVNMDEPFELGQGKNLPAVQEIGTGKLYMEFIHKIHKLCQSHGKKMLMWGDVIFTHPELIHDLPEDVTVLDWIYEGDATFEAHCQSIAKTGRKFILCPGTSSWCSFTGRTDNMIKNIRDAVHCAVQYGAEGVILTDWGDLGHWQYFPASWLPFAYNAAYTWSGDGITEEEVEAYCDRYIFQDPECKTAALLRDLGNYYHLEHATLYNTTLAFAVMSSKYRFETPEQFPAMMERMLTLSKNIAHENSIPYQEPSISVDYEAMECFCTGMEQRIAALTSRRKDAELMQAELQNSLRMIRHGISLYKVLTEAKDSPEKLTDASNALFDDLSAIMEEHYRLWMARNRRGGYSKSIEQMRHLLDFYLKQKTTPHAQ